MTFIAYLALFGPMALVLLAQLIAKRRRKPVLVPVRYSPTGEEVFCLDCRRSVPLSVVGRCGVCDGVAVADPVGVPLAAKLDGRLLGIGGLAS